MQKAIFKENLVDIVNPDLLYRLWLKSGSRDIFIYKKFGVRQFRMKTPAGQYMWYENLWGNKYANQG